MNLKPIGDRVVIEVKKEEEKVVGGIVLPGSAKEKPYEGKVIAVGDGKYENGTLIPMSVKAGDNVIYSKYAGSEVKIDDVEYLVCKQDDILAIVE